MLAKKWFALVAGVSVWVGLTACQPPGSSTGQRYQLKGKVVAVDKPSRRVTVAHEDIKGYMGAMVMPFVLKDDWAVATLVPGDEINATLVVSHDSSWLEDPVITSESAGAANTGKPDELHQPQPGDAVPDFTLVNQDGKHIHLSQYRGKALLLTFIYTRCPLPDYCPLMSSNFAQINKELQKDPALYAQTHLLSVSFDSAYDTPKVLRSYGAAYTEKYSDETFDHWEFASGSADEVKQLAQFFGLRYWQDTGQIIHSLRTAIIAPDGKLLKLYEGNEWKPADVLSDLQNLASNHASR